MNKIINFFRKKYFLLAMILLGVYFLGEIIVDFGYFSSDVGSTLMGLTKLVVDAALVVIFLVVFIKKKEELLSIFFFIIIIAFGYDSLRNYSNSLAYLTSELRIAAVYGVFDMLLLAMIAFMFVTTVIAYIGKKTGKLAGILDIFALIIIPFSILTGIFFMSSLAAYQEFFSFYFQAIGRYFAFIPLMAITYLKYFSSSKDEVIEETPKENEPEVVEAEVEEEVIDEK